MSLNSMFVFIMVVSGYLDPGDSIRVILQSDSDNLARRKATEQLVGQGNAALIPLLEAMGGEDPVPANWLRSAFEKIVSTSKEPPSLDAIKTFALDRSKNGRGRRLALELLEKNKQGTIREFLANAVDDPEFRLDAIDQLLSSLKDKPTGNTIQQLKAAWESARDPGQIKQVSQLLKSAGVETDLIGRLGLIRNWQVIGPFDDIDFKGFAEVFPPEKELNFQGTFAGKSGSITWKPVQGSGIDGKLDFLQSIGNIEGAVAYAYAEFDSPRAIQATILAGADDNLAIWVNGKKVLSQGSYHGHLRMDWFQAPIQIKEGPNTVLVKVCQAPPKPEKGPGPPNKWEFVLRITGEDGLGAKLKQKSIPSPFTERR